MRIGILLGFIISWQLHAQTGIGTTTPVNKFQVETNTADPAISGISANGNLRLSGTSGASHVLDFGLSSSSTYSWLQSRSRTNYATNFNLILNPNGGNVGIGATSPLDRIVIGAAVAIHDGGHKVIGLGHGIGNGALVAGFPAEIRLDPALGLLSFGTTAASTALGATPIMTQRMAISSNGNVGIGNTAPGATLELGSTNGSVPGNLILNPTTTGNGVEGAEINLRPAPLTTSPVAQTWVIDQVSNNNNPRLRLFPGNTGEGTGVTIEDTGFVGIGINNPTVKLHVNGDIIANSIAGSSDSRFKTNVRPVTNALDKVKALQGVYFNWNQEAFPARDFPNQNAIGFIAQEVEKVLPEVVQTEKTAEGYKAVQYDKVVALLVEAIKEQQQQIDVLKQQIRRLKRNKK